MSNDSSSAYESYAQQFLDARDNSKVGIEVAQVWANSLSAGAEVLEIACGGGYPVTRILVDAGLKIWAIDSSQSLLSKFKKRFPEIPTECASVQRAAFFERKFDAVISIGLVFLLSADEQATFINRVSSLLNMRGRFLFTAPLEIGTWADVTTGHMCQSLGRVQYEELINDAGLSVIATYEDEGRNNYYDVEKIQAQHNVTK